MEFGIALGSNLGDRLKNLTAAREAMREFGDLLESAPIYSTSPVDCPPGSPDFFNTVILFESDWLPISLLLETQKIELQLGRASVRENNTPRPVDIDLLYADDMEFDLPQLKLPHPRLVHRRFVLEPLATLRPDFELPGEDKTIAQLLSELKSNEPPLKVEHLEW